MMMSALRVLALCACMCSTLGVKLEGNGYHIKVAINKQVPEDPQIISQLKGALESASNYLYRSTRNHFYIKDVTILVPETWATKPEWKPSSLIFREADIRVDSPHPSMSSNPYTFQPGLCGDEGRYIHLTPDFVLDDRGDRHLYYGDIGRLMVHEFAHLRYGVFDEYGDKGSHQHPVGYVNNNKLEPTACSKDIAGVFLNMKTEKACFLSDENRLSDDCAFIVNSFESKATSSVMFAQYLDEVVDFCETNTTDPKLKHNADAPNKHNKMCNERGTWDIIKEHPDFLHSSANNVADTTPTFEVVQHQMKVVNETGVCGRRFVFVLDTSGSMGTRIFKLRQMADKIIRDILPLGTEVGIVTFSSSATVLADMRYLTSEADRQTLAGLLPTSARGSTAIGKGLLEGIDLLEENNKSAADGRIFLITDGGENVAPKVSTILSEIVSKNVVVHTLAYSRAAAVVLRELSDRTDGFYSFFDESVASTELESAALRLLKDITICESGEQSIEIFRQAIVMNTSSNSYKQNIDIDSTIGNNTLFVFTLSSGATTKIQVTDPNGNVYDDKTPNYSKDETLNIIRFHFSDAQQGLWKYALERGTSGTESVVAVVKSNQRSPGTLPIEVESWVGNTTVDLGTGQGLVVYSYVHQGYAPIIKAEVKAVVSGMGVQEEITLWDNGTFPDNTANDGVYTRFTTHGFSANERHSLDISVKSVDGQTAVIRERPLASSRAPVIYPNNTKPVVLEPVDPFTRTSSAGAVDVEGFVPNVDQIDPGRVTDLEVIIADRDNRHVTLTWTAPGDDLYEGTVDRYDIGIAESFEHLRQNFSASYKIMESDIKKGDNSPVPAGSQQSMTVSLSGHLGGDSYVFGLKAFDESNRSSDLSNLKAVTFAKIVIPGPSPDGGPDDGPDDPPQQPMLLIIIVASICFVVLVLVAVVVSCLICKLCRKKPKSDTNGI